MQGLNDYRSLDLIPDVASCSLLHSHGLDQVQDCIVRISCHTTVAVDDDIQCKYSDGFCYSPRFVLPIVVPDLI